MEFLAVKENGVLRPAYSGDWDVFNKWRNGDVIALEGKKPRSIQKHRKLFALIDAVLTNFPEAGSNRKQFLDRLKMSIGWVDTLRTLNEEIVEIPRSISFSNCNEAEFEEFYILAAHKIYETFFSDYGDFEFFENDLINLFDY